MQKVDWRRSAVEGLAVATAIYLVMRFLVPHSIDNDARSLIGAVAAFVITMIVSSTGKAKLR